MKPEKTYKIIEKLIKKYPDEAERIKTGVRQVLIMWTKKDGTSKEFMKALCYAGIRE